MEPSGDCDATGGAGTPRKSLWRSASWSTRSPTSVTDTTRATTLSREPATTTTKLRPSIHLPPLSVSRYSQAWPRAAAADTSNSSPAASSLVDGDLSRITDYIYLGGDAAARDRNLLRRHGITHVLNCAGFSCRERFTGDFHYKTLWLRDQPGEDISSLLYDVFDFIEEARAAFRGRGRTLVHCSRGTSRSAALVVAYLMWRLALSFDDALNLVRASRVEADPNPGFAAQLLQRQRLLLASPPPTLWPDIARRVYRMAPHSAYDPLHLVPKTVDRPGPAELDSRGAFLVHASKEGSGAVYLWVGTECERTMVESAAAAAQQVLRYERAMGPIVVVDEGAEPADFWDALGCDLSAVARKRMEAYDLDFEIHKRALKGVPTAAVAPTPLPGIGRTIPAVDPESGEDSDAAVPFGSPSTFSGGSVTPSSSSDTSNIHTSPTSFTSDWYNSSPGSDLSFRDVQSLSPPAPPLPLRVPSLVDGGVTPLMMRPHGGVGDNIGDTVMDWAFSPYRVGREEDDAVAMSIHKETKSELHQAVEAEGATLYHWQPLSETVNIVHPAVLDSESVFLLLIPARGMGTHGAKRVYVWVGRRYCLTRSGSGGAGRKGDDDRDNFERIGHHFLNQMMLPMDVSVQVVRENEEPEEFLSHLFTFHPAKNSRKL
ncbi:unnamed protein product [Spirodela intermedia]|uniref:Uncharacterized protein n=1 Tax=Spirodela intermedia TaxID=51605 RepID=A0A7I8KXG3_SPIIN|nr:unnamed protein product [Spirodela intermedia]